MIIVSGHLSVAPQQREAYLATCVEVVTQARDTEGCLDFAVSGGLIDCWWMPASSEIGGRKAPER